MVLSWEPGNEAKTILLKQPIEILSNLSKQPIQDLNLFSIYTQNQNQLHNMKIMLHNLVGHSTDYLISCSTGVLFAARPTTRLMSSQRLTCLDPVPCRAPLPSVQCTHYNLWCHHIKLGELSETYPTMRTQIKKNSCNAGVHSQTKCILNSREVLLCKLPQARCRGFQWPQS